MLFHGEQVPERGQRHRKLPQTLEFLAARNLKWITRAPRGNNAFLVASNVWHLGRRYLRVIIFEISVSSRAFALHRAVFSVYPGRVAPSCHAKLPFYHRSLSYIHRRADPSVYLKRTSCRGSWTVSWKAFARCDFRSSKKLFWDFFLSPSSCKFSFLNLICLLMPIKTQW